MPRRCAVTTQWVNAPWLDRVAIPHRSHHTHTSPIHTVLTYPTDDEEVDDNLEPISESNIISGGRRTRGKTIDWEEVRNKNSDDMEEDEDDDEDYQGGAGDDDQMRD